MFRSLLLLGLSLSVLNSWETAAQQAEPVTISGRILDRMQAAVPGARIVLLRSGVDLASTVSDNQGSFAFAAVKPGGLSVTVESDGFRRENRDIGASTTIEFVLEADTLRQSVTVTESVGYRVETAVSATKMPTDLRDIPQAIAVVNQELMRAQASLSMQDVLRNVSGVSVHMGEGRRDQVYIRGFSALRDTYIDGVRDDATYYRDLSNIESVEVIKGPASVLYGRGSSGGIINRVTKKPNTERTLGEITVTAGSYGTRRTTFDGGTPWMDGRLAFRVNGAYEDSGSHRHYYSLDRYAISPSLVWRPSDRTQVLGQFEHVADDRVPDRGIPSLNGRPAPVGVGAYYGYPQDDFLNNQVTSQALSFDHQFSSLWSFRNVFRHGKYRGAYSNTYPTGIRQSGADLLVTRGQYNSNGYQENYFNQTEAVGSAQTLGITHTFLLGVEVGNQDTRTDRFTGTADSVSLQNPFLTRPRYSGGLAATNDFKGETAGIYFQDQIRLTSKWKALVGIRRDIFRQRLNDLSPANIDLRRTDRAWSPRAGLVYQPFSWTSLYASYSRSFQPSGDGLSLATNTQDLKPETSQSYEVGAKNDVWRGRLSATVAAFRLDRNNLRTIDPIDPTRLVMVGRQRAQGVELSLSGTITARWSVYGGWAWLNTKILRSNDVTSGVPLLGNRAGHIPVNSGSLWSTYSFDNGFGIGGGVTYNSLRFTSNDNLVALPGYQRIDAALFYRKRRYEAALNLRNLLNAGYYETAHGNFQIYPGAPVNGLLTLRYRW